jgi:two-component system, chemotaxis family, protein-glutamate methylesterase/glutaminase
MTRVLIVEASPALRLLIRLILECAPEIKVVGEAAPNEDSIALCARLRPDIIALDVDLPGMEGCEAVRRLMSESPCPIVVVTATDSRKMLDVSFRALALGALSILPKPTGMPDRDIKAATLLTQVRLMAAVRVDHRRHCVESAPVLAPDKAIAGPSEPGTHPQLQLVAMGVSTGGPPALQAILNAIPASFTPPIAIVQHLTHGLIAGLASWLSETTPFQCVVGQQGDMLQPGRVYLAPDDTHFTVTPTGQVSLDAPLPQMGLRPSVNRFFDSVARSYGASAAGVLLTGMGQDGAQGLLAMRRAGAFTIAQDEVSSVIFGMPRAAIDLGAAKEVLPLEQIGPKIRLLAGL